MFTVTLEPSGRRFTVTEDEVLLDKALAEGIRMPHGCRAGSCKSCKARVVSGRVEVGRAFPAPSFLLRRRQFDGFTLMCRATAASDLVIAVDEQPTLPEPRIVNATVSQVDFVRPDVAILRLRTELADAVPFVPGQYVDFRLPDGSRRSYSIANAATAVGADELEFHVRHLPGGRFTDRLFAGLAVGEPIEFEAPLGSFHLREADKPALLIASGTGYAPIRSILLSALARNRGRRFLLYWGGRRPADLYRLAEAEALARENDNLAFVPVISEPAKADCWEGRTGLVHEAAIADIPDMAGWQVYACGTPAMVEAARHDFTRRCHLDPDAFFADAFLSQADLEKSAA